MWTRRTELSQTAVLVSRTDWAGGCYGRYPKACDILTTLRSIVLSLVFLALVAWNFGAINTSAEEVLGMVSHVQQFEANGIKVVLRDDAKLKANVSVADVTLSETEKRATVEAAKSSRAFKPNGFSRS